MAWLFGKPLLFNAELCGGEAVRTNAGLAGRKV